MRRCGYLRRLRIAQALAQSRLFDEKWYLLNYPDVAYAGISPLLHYVKFGAAEKRDPNPLFDTSWYLEQNPDVAKTGINPLLHYLNFGAAEGRNPNPLFDTDWYLTQNPDAAKSDVNPLVHYLSTGAAKGRDPNPLFDTDWYLGQNPDVAKTGVNPLAHYLRSGARGGRDPHLLFDTKWYLSQFPSVAAARFNPLWHYLNSGVSEGRSPSYRWWLARFDAPLDDNERTIFRDAIDRFASRPVISILMPTRDVRRVWLGAAIASIQQQIYQNWRLSILVDTSADPDIQHFLDNVTRFDPRIRAIDRKAGSDVSETVNIALNGMAGEYIALMEPDSLLAEHALFWLANEILQHPTTDLIYCDEDIIDEKGVRSEPNFKSNWNPSLILSQDMFGRFGVFRKSVIEKAGGLPAGLGQGQIYYLVLQCAELSSPENIRHIPRILYHARLRTDTIVSTGDIDDANNRRQSAIRAIREHLARCKIPATVRFGQNEYYQVDYELAAPIPKISIIVASTMKQNLLLRCVESVLASSTYPNFEFLIAVNRRIITAHRQEQFLRSTGSDARVKFVAYEDQPFNYSRINNWAVRQSSGSIICLLNDDTEIITPNWLEKLAARIQHPGVGAVGPLLLYPDNSIQHAGVILGLGGVAGHPFRKLSKGHDGYFGRAKVEQDLSCVTAACIMIPRAIFDSLGGFDEMLAIAYNDVDLCLRIREAGWRIIWTPDVELYHHESASVGLHNSADRIDQFLGEMNLMRKRWAGKLDSDPFYNPNLSLTSNYFALSCPPRLARLPEIW